MMTHIDTHTNIRTKQIDRQTDWRTQFIHLQTKQFPTQNVNHIYNKIECFLNLVKLYTYKYRHTYNRYVCNITEIRFHK